MKLFVLLVLLTLNSLAQAQPPRLPVPEPAEKRVVQTPPAGEEVGEGDVLRINANLVSIPVTVLNRQGQYVVDLARNDFRVYENNEEQTIAHFSDVDRPFSVVLLIDTSSSTAPFLDQAKAAAKTFVEQLRPSDTVRPVYFHGDIKSLTSGSTNDLKVLNTAIDQLQLGPEELGTRLYDAVDFSMNTLRTEKSRKAIILFTDGENTWGKATMKSTLAEAEESDVVIYALQYGALPPQKYLQELAYRTGGRYFRAGSIDWIRQSFAGVAEELRRQYLIGYYPKENGPEGKVRKIKVKVNRKNVAVRSRESYTQLR